MADRFAEPPSFDEYVVARGADLLRTAWLLVGDDRRAEDLVRADARPQLAAVAPPVRGRRRVLRRGAAAVADGDLPAAFGRCSRQPRRARETCCAARRCTSSPPTKADVLRALGRVVPPRTGDPRAVDLRRPQRGPDRRRPRRRRRRGAPPPPARPGDRRRASSPSTRRVCVRSSQGCRRRTRRSTARRPAARVCRVEARCARVGARCGWPGRGGRGRWARLARW